jgi:hypothetical protein
VKPWSFLAWLSMTVLALAIAGYAAGLLLLPSMRSSFVLDLLAQRPLATMAHFGGGALALATGGFQLAPWLRSRLPAVHRWMGRAYVLGVALGGSAGLSLGLQAHGGVPAALGFVGLALAWLGTTAAALRSILRGDVPMHRRWMIHSFALTYAAVTLRLYIPASQAAGIPFDVAYPVIAWACWVPNLALAALITRETISTRRTLPA